MVKHNKEVQGQSFTHYAFAGKGDFMKKVISLVLLAVMILSPMTLAGCSKKTNVDLKANTQVSFSGYNGEGSVRVDINYDKIASLFGEMNMMTVASIVDSFEPQEIANNGTLKNGDKVKVKIDYDKDIMKNAKVSVSNAEFDVVVEGLKEKEKLDVFANVTLETDGTSPECTIKVSYNGDELSTYSLEIVDWDYNKHYKNGDKVIVKISDSAVENLQREYIIEETSHEFTVQADSRYILTAADLNTEDLAKLNEAAQKNLDEQIQNILDDKRSAGKWVIANLTGQNPLSVGSSNAQITSVENVKFNSSYVGTAKIKGAFGNITEHKYVYFFYDADFSHNYKTVETINGALFLQFTDVAVTADGISFSNVAVGARKDFQTAYDELIQSEFEKLS